MVKGHALPEDWQKMEYSAFLGERRQLMAGVVRDAFERLKGSGHPDVIATDDGTLTTADVEALIEARESQRVEFKTSMRASEGKDPVPAKVLEKVIAKTVAGFMNAEGGTLLIGVRDDGEIAGLDADLRTVGRHDFDGFEQAFVNVIKTRLGAQIVPLVRLDIVSSDAKEVAVVRCRPHTKPVYLHEGEAREFYVRAGNTTQQMNVEQAHSYMATHWPSR